MNKTNRRVAELEATLTGRPSRREVVRASVLALLEQVARDKTGRPFNATQAANYALMQEDGNLRNVIVVEGYHSHSDDLVRVELEDDLWDIIF